MKTLLLFATLICFSVTALPTGDGERFLKLADDASGKFTPCTKEEFLGAKRDLSAAVGLLKRFLEAAGPEISEGWLHYLDWNRLEAEVSKEDGEDINVLQEVLAKFYQPYDGLDLAAFLKTRALLKSYICKAKLFYGVTTPVQYTQTLQEMKNLLQQSASVAELSVDQKQRLAELYGWLVENTQALPLTAALSKAFGNENIQLKIKSVAKRAILTLDQWEPVNSFFAGADIFGNTHTQATASLVFYPNPLTADVRVVLQGIAETSSTAYQGRVAVSSLSHTNLFGTKRIGFNDLDLRLYPALADCRTSSVIQSISAGPLIRGIAWRRASALQPEANAFTSGQANQKVIRQLDEKVKETLSKVQSLLKDNLTAPFQRVGFLPLLLNSSTTRESLVANFLVKRAEDFGAVTPAPKSDGASDFEISIHETAFANAMGILLGGVKMSDVDIASLAQLLFSQAPEALQPKANSDDWYVILASKRPVSLQFPGKNRMTLVLNLERLVRREVERENGPMQSGQGLSIALSYQMQKNPEGWDLVREGAIGLTAGEPLDADLRQFFEEKLALLFQERASVRDDILQKRFLQTKIKVTLLESENGWLQIGAN